LIKDFLKDKRVCIIGSHPDDIELAMGGTLWQICHNIMVRCIILSPSTNIPGNSGITENLQNSMDVYGIDNYHLYPFTTRHFHEERANIKDLIYQYKDYDFFFTHSPNSAHSDHKVVGESVQEVIKDKTILCFENINDNSNMKINWYNEIDASDLAAKYRALDFYTTQKAKRKYFNDDSVATLAKIRGAQIGETYAEGFEFVRAVT